MYGRLERRRLEARDTECCEGRVPKPIIRALTDEDLPAVSKLFRDVFSEPPWNEKWSPKDSDDQIRKMYDAPERVALASLDGERIVGVLLGTTDAKDRFLRIRELLVDKGFRRCGHGSALVNEAISSLPQMARIGVTAVTKVDTPAYHFYKLHGFEVVGRLSYSEVKVTMRRCVGPT
jgi:aminoglycoside 6'-N-acetyltransferase I